MGTDEAGTAERRRADSSVPGSAEVRRELRREKPGAVVSRSLLSAIAQFLRDTDATCLGCDPAAALIDHVRAARGVNGESMEV